MKIYSPLFEAKVTNIQTSKQSQPENPRWLMTAAGLMIGLGVLIIFSMERAHAHWGMFDKLRPTIWKAPDPNAVDPVDNDEYYSPHWEELIYRISKKFEARAALNDPSPEAIAEFKRRVATILSKAREKCDFRVKVLEDIRLRDSITEIDDLDECSVLYWHHGEFDPGFKKQIILNYRYIEILKKENARWWPWGGLEGGEVENLRNAITSQAWLLWSKWVTWKKDPALMPDGENCDKEAFDVIEMGAGILKKSAQFYLDAGHSLHPLVKRYHQDKFSLIIKIYKKADELATTPNQHLRARLDLGHCYRQMGNRHKAIEAYRSALQIKRDNHTALAELAKYQKN